MINVVVWIWLWFSIGVIAWIIVLLFIWALCVAAARGDRTSRVIYLRRFHDESM